MRICIAYSGANKKIEEMAKSLYKGLEQQGFNLIDIVDIDKDSDKKLTGYKYILFGCGKVSTFSNQIPRGFNNFLKNCGHITGKHAYIFTSKGFFAQGFLSKLMAELEKEGVVLKTSSVLRSPEEARVIGSRLHIK